MTRVTISITTKQETEPIQYYQYGDDFQVLGGARACASGGCPAVMTLQDDPDTKFTKDWQFYVYAINKGMSLNAIIAIMGTNKALFNNSTGFGGSNVLANYLTGSHTTDGSPPPRIPKLITMALSGHTGYDDGTYMYIKTMDGNNPPPVKPGKLLPQTLEQVTPDDYLYHPKTHPELFMDCKNVQWKLSPKRLAYGPWANGIQREWLDSDIHTFFPLVSTFPEIRTPLRNWIKLPLGSEFPAPFRR